MKVNEGIPATVRRIEPETEYEDTVFDQTVIVGLPNGSSPRFVFLGRRSGRDITDEHDTTRVFAL